MATKDVLHVHNIYIYIYHKVLCIAPQKLGVKCLKTPPQSLCIIRTKNEEIFNHDF